MNLLLLSLSRSSNRPSQSSCFCFSLSIETVFGDNVSLSDRLIARKVFFWTSHVSSTYQVVAINFQWLSLWHFLLTGDSTGRRK